ncbi:MAG: hypothetical protein QM485_15715 [Flavobacteriaceae bacterium]
MKRQITIALVVLILIGATLWSQEPDWKYKPVAQPDADGWVIMGRKGTHHWQDYM